MTWLVAKREIVVRSRDRSLLISTLITVAIVAAIVLLPSLFGGTTTVTVAAAGEQVETVRAAERLEKAFDVDVVLVEAADPAGAVRDDAADAALTPDGIVLGGSATSETLPLLQEASRQLRAQAPDPPPLGVEELNSDSEERQGFAALALLVLYGQLLGYGLWVAMGVVEEKSSRIVEILLAVLNARELLFGKVLGIGIVGLGQLLVIAVAGLGIALGAGEIELGGEELSTLPIVLAWFVLGYALYAGAFALAGSLVSRQEDVQSVTTPMVMILIATLVIGFPTIDDPSSSMAKVLSFVPLSAPLIMPVRMIAGDVGVLEVLIAVGIVGICTYAVIAFAARLYGTAVLQTGGRIKLRQLTSGLRGAP